MSLLGAYIQFPTIYDDKMKTKNLILAILIFGLISCAKEPEQGIIINGLIIGLDNPKSVEYTVPIDEKWFYGDKQTMTVDSTGRFQIKIEVDKPSFTSIYVPGKPSSSGVILVEPGKTYDVEVNVNASRQNFLINSADSAGQNFYNSLPLPDFFMLALNEFVNDSIPSAISSKLSELKEREISRLDELLENREISQGFHELAVLDRKCYYLGLEASIASFLLSKSIAQKDFDDKNKAKNYWSKKLEVSRLNESDYTRSPWHYALANSLIKFTQYSAESFDLEGLRKNYESGYIYQYDINEAKKYLSGEELEYYLASYIYSVSRGTKDKSKEIIVAYENFKSDYPRSSYNEYLATSVEPIITFYKEVEKAQENENIRFIENDEGINTFDNLMVTLRGKKVYVDIWGTWCDPCKKEFEQKEVSAQLLKSKDIVPLYICEGRSSKEKMWKEMIKFYDLEGYHVFTNQELRADIITEFGNNGQFSFPRYLLVDENGKVVNQQASYPSNIEQLEREINESYIW
ncbi:MAG: redoxin family protein [Bacteroidota bacterium]